MKNETDVEIELGKVVDDLAFVVLPHLRGAAALIEASESFNDGDELPSALILVTDSVRDLVDLQVRAEAALVRYTQERRDGVLTLLEPKSPPAVTLRMSLEDPRPVATPDPRADPPGLASPSS